MQAPDDSLVGETPVLNDDLTVQLEENGHWRETHATRAYVIPGSTYQDYSGAYALGEGVRRRYPGQHFDDLDEKLAADWGVARRKSLLDWDQARPAAREAWERSMK